MIKFKNRERIEQSSWFFQGKFIFLMSNTSQKINVHTTFFYKKRNYVKIYPVLKKMSAKWEEIAGGDAGGAKMDSYSEDAFLQGDSYYKE